MAIELDWSSIGETSFQPKTLYIGDVVKVDGTSTIVTMFDQGQCYISSQRHKKTITCYLDDKVPEDYVENILAYKPSQIPTELTDMLLIAHRKSIRDQLRPWEEMLGSPRHVNVIGFKYLWDQRSWTPPLEFLQRLPIYTSTPYKNLIVEGLTVYNVLQDIVVSMKVSAVTPYGTVERTFGTAQQFQEGLMDFLEPLLPPPVDLLSI